MLTFAHQVTYLAVIALPILISGAAFFVYWWEYLASYLEPDVAGASFDFIIVGGGSAGAVLATRLSEVKSYKVLLIEAGGEPSLLTGIPVLASYLQLSPYDWQHLTVPQERACGMMVERRCRWPSGKVLGGSSGINYMLYVRGNSKDYDSWSEAGNQGWSAQHLEKYFSKSVIGHRNTGKLPIEDTIYSTPLQKEYLAMLEEAGFPIRDVNTGNQTGFMAPQVNLHEGRRGDTYRSYLRPVMARPNLTVLKNARVLRILVENGAAVGVLYSRYGREATLRAAKEVIVSAGTVNSGKLLLLSGIGPADHLRSLGIKVEADLPVGENLQDHVTSMLGPFILDKPWSFLPSRLLSFQTVWDYLTAGEGPLASTVACDVIGFLNSGRNLETSFPDLQLHFISSSLMADFWTFFWRTFGLDGDRMWEGYIKHIYYPKNMEAVSILPVVLRPRSRGTVRLQSSNPWDQPLVDPNYFGDPEDLDLLVEALETAFRLVNTSTRLQQHKFQMPQLPLPDCEFHQLFSSAYWRCYVQQITLTMYHPVGTCKMAPDQTGVLDHELKVKGVRGLRVIDASIMPTIVSGNTNAATVMIAEKGSDMIKSDWPVTEHSWRSSKDEL